MHAVVLCGIQGSGKTTFYRERFFHSHLRLSLDQLKTRARENVLLHACLVAQQPFVVDNTNLTAAQRKHYIDLARAAGFKTALYFFDTRTRDAIARNANRPERERVPRLALLGSQKKLQPPTLDEGFDEIQLVIAQGGNFTLQAYAQS